DGATVFLDEGASARDQLRQLAVQSVLLGAGGLDAGIVSALGRRPGRARRYLAIEGNRALAAHDDRLPPGLRGLAGPAIGARVDSPAASLALASSATAIADPPDFFGAIRARQVRASAATAADPTVRPAAPAARAESPVQLRELDDADADDPAGPDAFTSPVG